MVKLAKSTLRVVAVYTHFALQKQPHFDLQSYWKCYQNDALGDLRIFSLPGVFSANELDNGTSLLLSTLTSPIQGKVLDVGCGAGVIGSMIKTSPLKRMSQ